MKPYQLIFLAPLYLGALLIIVAGLGVKAVLRPVKNIFFMEEKAEFYDVNKWEKNHLKAL